MKNTPVTLLQEQITFYEAMRDIVLGGQNKRIPKIEKDKMICDINKKIKQFESAIKILNKENSTSVTK